MTEASQRFDAVKINHMKSNFITIIQISLSLNQTKYLVLFVCVSGVSVFVLMTMNQQPCIEHTCDGMHRVLQECRQYANSFNDPAHRQQQHARLQHTLVPLYNRFWSTLRTAQGAKQRLHLWQQLYKENQFKILQCPDHAFKRGDTWIALQEESTGFVDDEECMKQLSEYVCQYSQHIPFNVFYTRLITICTEVLHAAIQGKFKNVILLVSGTMNSSNFWTSLLATLILAPVLTDIGMFIGGSMHSQGRSWLNVPTEDTLYLFCEDCLYPGSETIDTLLEQTFADQVPTVILICPYIACSSEIFHPTVLKRVHFIVPANVYYFDALQRQLSKQEQRQHTWKPYWSNLHCITFNHGIADEQVVYHDLYQQHFQFNNGLPQSFPGTIQYTFNSKPIANPSELSVHSWLLQQLCGTNELHHFNLQSIQIPFNNNMNIDHHCSMNNTLKIMQHQQLSSLVI